MVLQPHNSEFTIEFLQDLSQFVVMVLQPHNSEFTLESLQDLRTISKQLTQNFNQIHTRTCKSLCKFTIKIFISNSIPDRKKGLFNSTDTLLNTRRSKSLDYWISSEQVGWKERQQFSNYFTNKSTLKYI